LLDSRRVGCRRRITARRWARPSALLPFICKDGSERSHASLIEFHLFFATFLNLSPVIFFPQNQYFSLSCMSHVSVFGCCTWRAVNSTNVLDEGLRIGEIGRRMNSKVNSVKQGGYKSKRGCKPWLAFNLAYTVPSWPLYIGGQVSRIG
jgi:hypothetical protein